MFEGWELGRQFTFLRECGYEGVELAPFTIASDVREISAGKRSEVARLAREAGIKVIGLHWLLVGPKGLYITHTDSTVRQETAGYLAELMRFCADVSGKVLVFGSPAQRNLLPGVTLCLEPLPPPECTFINTTREAIEVIDAIGHANLRLILDVKSMAGEEKLTGSPIPDTIRRTMKYVAHVQSNDSNRGHPGSGETDYVPIFRALTDVGYDGFVSVEAFDFTPGPEKIAKESIEYMRRTLQEAQG